MRFANHRTIYQRLGLNPDHHLGPKGLDYRTINVAHDRSPPLTMPVMVTDQAPPGSGAMFRHRVLAECRCGGEIPTGRLGQHVRACIELQRACDEADQTR